MLKTIEEDLRCEQERKKSGIGETLQNYVHRAELSHMESPEADEKFLVALGSKVDDLFSKIPLPDDPMKAALSPTPEDMQEEAAAEIVKEAVREAYWRRLDAKQAEELRLRRAQEKLRRDGPQKHFSELSETNETEGCATSSTMGHPFSQIQKRTSKDAGGSVVEPKAETEMTREALLKELSSMRERMAEMESQLRKKT